MTQHQKMLENTQCLRIDFNSLNFLNYCNLSIIFGAKIQTRYFFIVNLNFANRTEDLSCEKLE